MQVKNCCIVMLATRLASYTYKKNNLNEAESDTFQKCLNHTINIQVTINKPNIKSTLKETFGTAYGSISGLEPI